MKVEFNAEKIQKAIETIQSGVCKRVDIDDHTKVYEVKNVIRIDLKAQ
ncbi:MAG: hypothetical protein NC489_18985 [Ruminococcus flavefaciens]|nr:hypothetical protein [Ruminococcus flavefaciens]